jgi:hypothetical protein
VTVEKASRAFYHGIELATFGCVALSTPNYQSSNSLMREITDYLLCVGKDEGIWVVIVSSGGNCLRESDTRGECVVVIVVVLR